MPFALKGEPLTFAELPGVIGLSGPQVFVGAPFCPVVGLTMANAAVGAVASRPAASAPTMRYLRMCLSRAVRDEVRLPRCNSVMRLVRPQSRKQAGHGSISHSGRLVTELARQPG